MVFTRPIVRTLLAALLGLSAPIVGCGLLGGAVAEGPDAPSGGLRLLGSGELSGIEESFLGVARDAATWEAIWRRHEPEGDVPPIDFSADMGLLVVRPHNTGGYSLRIEKLEQQPDHLLLTLVEEQPHEDELVIQVLTQPWVALRLPQYAGPVRLSVLAQPHP